MMHYFLLLLRIAIAILLVQTLYFKFTAHPDSVYIFTEVGMEPWGRIGIGIAELIAAVLLLIPSTVAIGATLTVGIIAGAIMMHLTLLGIEVQGDGGQLFYMAVGIFVGAMILLWNYRKSIPMVGKMFS